jgi:hypothetical protein
MAVCLHSRVLHHPSAPLLDATPPQAGKAWLASGRPDAAAWPFQQLRERLARLEAVSADPCQPADVAGAAQLLQFYALQGSMVLAGRAGHQASRGARVMHMFLAGHACRRVGGSHWLQAMNGDT